MFLKEILIGGSLNFVKLNKICTKYLSYYEKKIPKKHGWLWKKTT